jgi:ribosomal protein S18 acetylase RimI-like enzyme
MSDPVQINCREATLADVNVITDYNCRLAKETEDRVLETDVVRNGVRRGLQLAPEVRYFVAESEGRVIGQIMFTREWSDWRNGWMIWLQSVYVAAEFRQCGVFRRLLETSLQAIEAQAPVVCLRLYVEHENDAAKNCYRSLGFTDSGYQVMEAPTQRKS